MDNKEFEKREKEDATKYGEFVSSYFNWITPQKQKEVVDKLENITKERKSKKSKEKQT